MENSKDTPEKIALRDLVRAIRNNEEHDTNKTTGVTSVSVYITEPEIASALREAEAVLGIKVSK